MQSKPTESDFWAKVDVRGPDDCWEWQGRVEGGYGRFGPTLCGTMLAHRIAWTLMYGPPGALCVCHRCDNPVCLNPGHLWLGTRTENNADCVAKGRLHKGSINVGQCNPSAKLTEADVRAIRTMADNGITQAMISDQFGVSFQQVSRIVRRKRWRHVA